MLGGASVVAPSLMILLALGFAICATVGFGVFGIRRAYTTSDFFVASRSVSAPVNASAICGEYLSAASFLGIAGLVMRYGATALWYPVSYTAGYVVLLLFVASPLRRFGAYTIADFAQGRLDSLFARRLCSMLVVVISIAYLVPQMRGAGITLRVLIGTDYWVGVVVVASVVTLNVMMGGMRGITFVQALQYWFKWIALVVPVVVISLHFFAHRTHWSSGLTNMKNWSTSVRGASVAGGPSGYATFSFVVAQILGTLGLPHILLRFYTNPDGKTARRTTVLVLFLLSSFYILPPIIGAFGRLYATSTPINGQSDTIVLRLPSIIFSGIGGELLTALVACGAFAAFMSTASGLVISASGAISQDLFLGNKRDFRKGALIVGVISIILGLQVSTTDINQLVTWVFSIAASSFSPLVVLGIWWRRLSSKGAIAGLIVGSGSSSLAVLFTLFYGQHTHGTIGQILSQPALWSISLGFMTMIIVSLLTPESIPNDVTGMMVSMHTPEALGLAANYRN